MSDEKKKAIFVFCVCILGAIAILCVPLLFKIFR